jgi:hypothetical protein
MPIKLSEADQKFRNPMLFHIDPKTIDLERTLLNLFMLIKHNGVPPRSRAGRKKVTPDSIVEKLLKLENKGQAKGFADNHEPLKWWVMCNLLDLVNRGKADEAVASLKAIHLNAYKYRNPAHVRDYNLSDQVYVMLQEEPTLIDALKQLLAQGWNQQFEELENNGIIDVDTLGILRIVEDAQDHPSIDQRSRLSPCLCPGQARIFCDDVRRLLIYQHVMPRHVLLEYLRTLIGLHTGMYLLRLFHMLPDWVQKGARPSACQNCPVNAQAPEPFAQCPYQKDFELVVDCSDNPRDKMGQLAEANASYYFARIHDYIRATFAINFALQQVQGQTHEPDTHILDVALAAIKERGVQWDMRFQLRKEDLLNSLDEESRATFEPVISLDLPPFETYVELVTQARTSFHLKYHRQLLDSLFQKNRENGLLWSGKSSSQGRRFWLSSRLLETLVQLAVLKEEQAQYHSEPILIDEFIGLMQKRYGLIIHGIEHPRFQDADISVHQAFRANTLNLKQRLREIGFFNVLSDAYIMQRIRPRYPIENEATP